MTRTCLTCGKEFECNHRNQRYCTVECRPTHYQKKYPVHKTCAHCGKDFEAAKHTALYCSYKCRRAAETECYNATHTIMPKTIYHGTCSYCGAEFDTKYFNQKYCSVKCRQCAGANRHYHRYNSKEEE